MIFIKLVFSESVLGGILLGQALEGMKKTLWMIPPHLRSNKKCKLSGKFKDLIFQFFQI